MLKFIKFSILVFLLSFLFLANFSLAQEPILSNPENLKDCNCSAPNSANDACKLACKKQTGDYNLNDFLRIVITVSNLILGLVGSLALLAFVAGGLMMMLSAGNAEWVKRGQQTLIGAVIGLAVVFTSYAIIQLVFTSLDIKEAADGKWSASNWFK